MNQWVGGINNPINIEVLEESALAMAQSTMQKAINESGISRSDLARAMQIGRSGISRMLSGSHNLTIKSMARVLAGCGREIRFETVSIEWNWQSVPQPNSNTLPTNVGSTTCLQDRRLAPLGVNGTAHTRENGRQSWL